MNGEDWYGQAVRTRDGTMLGGVVGVFTEGALAGRLWVHRDHCRWTGWAGTAVYAIPCHAPARGMEHSLVLNATPAQARGAWLMHVLRGTAPSLMGGAPSASGPAVRR